MRPSIKGRRNKITAVAFVALISFGGLSSFAAPAHADGILAQLLPQLLSGNSGDDYYRRADHHDERWHRWSDGERLSRNNRHEENQRWRDSRDHGAFYRHRDGEAYRHYERGE